MITEKDIEKFAREMLGCEIRDGRFFRGRRELTRDEVIRRMESGIAEISRYPNP